MPAVAAVVAVIAHYEQALVRHRYLLHRPFYVVVPVGALVQLLAVKVDSPIVYAYSVPRGGYDALHALFGMIGVAADYYVPMLWLAHRICELFGEHALSVHEGRIHGVAYALHRFEYEGAYAYCHSHERQQVYYEVAVCRPPVRLVFFMQLLAGVPEFSKFFFA